MIETKVLTKNSIQKICGELQKSRAPILVDRELLSLYGDALRKISAQVIPVTGGENAKTWSELGRVLSLLADLKVERTQRLYVMGGGAVCDLGAFAAALYKRGMPLVLIPTTFLAQIDACIGGKSAVDINFEARILKNIIGTFYPAEQVWICAAFLESLSPKERRSGLAELLKIHWLHGNFKSQIDWKSWLGESKKLPKSASLEIEKAIELKRKIVNRDFRDLKGIRAQLNFGHTIGHAMESLASGKLTHGEAIAWGMWAECEFIKSKVASTIFARLMDFGFSWPKYMANFSAQDWEVFLAQDKKKTKGKIAVFVVSKFGKVSKKEVSPKELAQFCEALFTKTAIL